MRDYYNNKLSNLKELLNEQKKLNKKVSNIRLLFIVFVIIIIVIISNLIINTYVGVGAIFVLLFFEKFFKRNDHKIEKTNNLIKIYQNELDKNNIFGNGREYINYEHNYANDLDVFGKNSLFELINRTSTQEGNKILANSLLESSSNDLIIQRQKAISELSKKKTFKEEFLLSFFIPKNKQYSSITNYINKFKPYIILNRALGFYKFISPVVFLGSLLIGIFYPISFLLAVLFLIFNFLVITRTRRGIDKIDQYVSNQEKVFLKYAFLIKLIKNERFESQLLLSNKDILLTDNEIDKQFIKLARLSKLLDFRHNMMLEFLLNNIFLWDIHITSKIENWFIANSKTIKSSLLSIGHFDFLVSLSILSFNNNDWVFPTITDDYFSLKTQNIGHPLIDIEQRVVNDFSIMNSPNISIVSGSNMAGKSTFLRTLGINMILAFMGAPVCASSFLVSNVKILTYMKTQDSLYKNTSSFQAELNRIKKILDELETTNCFLLIDELLKGTNSRDKQLGSVAIVKSFINSNTCGIVTTHDLALADLEKEYPKNINNYNFNVSVFNEELSFDYKLKQGICKNFNASLLLKKIGLRL